MPGQLERDAVILDEDVRERSTLPRRRRIRSWPEKKYQIPFAVPALGAFRGVRLPRDVGPAIITCTDNARIGQDAVFVTGRTRPRLSSLIYQRQICGKRSSPSLEAELPENIEWGLPKPNGVEQVQLGIQRWEEFSVMLVNREHLFDRRK